MMLGVSIIVFMLAAWFSINSGAMIAAVFFGVLTVAAVVSFPSVITVSQAGVTAHHWSGRTITIPWSDVTRLEYRRGPCTTVVVGSSGLKISHSGFHRASQTFRQLCEQRSHVRVNESEF